MTKTATILALLAFSLWTPLTLQAEINPKDFSESEVSSCEEKNVEPETLPHSEKERVVRKSVVRAGPLKQTLQPSSHSQRLVVERAEDDQNANEETSQPVDKHSTRPTSRKAKATKPELEKKQNGKPL